MVVGNHRLVFSGDFDPSKSISTIKDELSFKYEVSDEMFARFMTGRPFVIKFGLSEPDAQTLREILEVIGLLCWVEPIPIEHDIDVDGFIERRGRDQRDRDNHIRRMQRLKDSVSGLSSLKTGSWQPPEEYRDIL